MNASVESIPVTPRAPAALRAAPEAPAPAREGVLEIPGALRHLEATLTAHLSTPRPKGGNRRSWHLSRLVKPGGCPGV